MRGEQCGYLRAMVTQVEDGERRLPFVGMRAECRTGLTGPTRPTEIIIQTLHHHAGSIAEEARLIIVAVSGMTLHLEFIPRPRVDSIFLRPKGIEFQQNGDWFTGHLPATDTDRNFQ